jgi:hypothetical protein
MMNKTILVLAFIIASLIVANAEALDNQEPLVKQSNASVKGDTSSNITCGDSTQLVGGWFGVINGMASQSTQECFIRVDSSGNLTGSCQDIHNTNSFIIRSGSIKFNNQCVVSFTMNYTNGVIATSSAMINKAGDIVIGTYENSQGDYGTFSGIMNNNLGKKGPAGGIIFYTTDDWLHGLEGAPVDLSGAQWGCMGTSIFGAEGIAVGTGAANTAAIVTGCADAGTAAKVADNYVLNGYSDWFLPSIDELELLFEQSLFVGGFASNGYFSSTEANSSFAWGQYFASGGQGYYGKIYALPVRAVRAF